VRIGGSADHAAIRDLGAGRHSFWQGTLYLSSSDNSDPRHNGRRYEVAWPSARLGWLELGTRWGGIALLAATLLLALCRAAGRRLSRWRPLLLKLSLVPASLALTLGAAELWLRFRYPFVDNTWPSRFDPGVGFVFEPGSTVAQTNLFDFCVAQRANSLGFLDREVAPRRDGVPRIVVLGDSFVEAVQVPIERKFHVLLEQHLTTRNVAADTVAFGYSGCGQANQLAFYERFAECRPGDLVIALFVINDIANNSALLEALRNGWHPEHTPRLFFRRTATGFERQPIDPDWQRHLLPVLAPATGAPASAWSWSRLYRWVGASRRWIDGTTMQTWTATVARRLENLRANPAHAAALADWRLPADDDIDTMTRSIDPPAAFRDAVALTEHAFAELDRRVRSDGARLVVVAAHNAGEPAVSGHGRAMLPHGSLDHLRPICDRLQLPLLDLGEAFAAAGVLGAVTFRRDGHWNATGHAHAAAAIDAWLAKHPELLGGP
jgi:hypothetical protein